MVASQPMKVALFVDKNIPNSWIVRDASGLFWVVPSGERAWERRERYTLSENAQLESIPAHYKYLLGI